MATFTRFDSYKLPTEFVDGNFKHRILARPSRVETWEKMEQLGRGGFGTVYRERCRETGAVRAVKEIRKSLAKSNEIGVLTKLSSYPQHFVQLMGWFEDKLNIYLAMEFLECGDLGSLMKEEDLSESNAKSVTVQVLEGLDIMHKNNLCHRDLKPGNILISRWMPLTVKIADFGVSKHFDGLTEGRTLTGSQNYMAPEVWGILQSDTGAYTTAVDIWSLGCMVYAMLTKEPPFPEPRGLMDYIQGRVTFPPKHLENASPLAVEFMASLLMPLPADRVTAEQAQQHSWVSVESGDDTVWTMVPSCRSSSYTASPLPAKLSPPAPVAREEEGYDDRTVFDPHNTFLAHKVKLPSSIEPSNLKVLPEKTRAITIAKATRKGPKEDAMIAAAASGNVELVRNMLDKGADLNSLDYQGKTALVRAANGNHLKLVKLLVERGAHVSQGNEDGITPLHTATEGGYLEMTEFLLAHGASVNERSLDDRDPLYFAGISGNLECVKFIIKSGADITHRSKKGYSALFTAVERAHKAVADYLISLGFDVMEESVDGRVVLDFAALSDNKDIIEFLVEKGADLSHHDYILGITALHKVAERGYLPGVTYLLQKGADVNDMALDGRKALYFACGSKNVDLVKYLLQNGATIGDRTVDGYTSLHRAAESGHIPMMKFVLEQGVCVTEPTTDDRAPLYFATLSGSVNAVLLLLEKGADIRCVTGSGMNLLMVAAARGDISLIAFFMSRGFRMEEKDPAGYNALHFAADREHLKASQHLVIRGANIMATINTGATALSLAGEKGHSEIVTYILERLETGNTAISPPPDTRQSAPLPTYLTPTGPLPLNSGSSPSGGSGMSSANSQVGMTISSVDSAKSSKKSRKGISSRIKGWFYPSASSDPEHTP